jgi:signal transduction histidine kinase
VTIQLVIAIISIDLMSAVRAYMTGEGLYSKGQKEAHLHLLEYARTFSEQDYERFEAYLSVPRGDRIAREALQQAAPDIDLATRGLAQARNHPADIPGAIRLFLWFQHTPLMKEAIATWTEGDRTIEQIAELARRARERIQAGDLDAPEVRAIQTQTPALDERMTELETKFAMQIGDGTRLGQQIVLGINLAFAIILALVGAAFVVTNARARAAAEERTLRADREHLNQLRQLNESRSRFLGKVGHELRSPLQGILSALDVLEFRHARVAASEDDELIRRVRRSSLLLNTHLNDLVTLAQGQAGRLELRPSAFEACELVETVAAAAREHAKRKGLDLRVRTPAAPLFVIADNARIDQVLTNLLTNSIRYTPRGFVSIELTSFRATTTTLEFVVSDSGPGLNDEALRALLPTESSAMPYSGQGQGSGIGLAIVGTLIRLLGGDIEVDGEPDRGTTFLVRVPVQAVARNDTTLSSASRET